MGIGQSRDGSETINWNNIKTENVSSTMPNFNGLSKDAKTPLQFVIVYFPAI